MQSPGAKALADPSQYPRLEAYVKDIVGRFAKDDRILGWDLWNEPDNSNASSYADTSQARFDHVAGGILFAHQEAGAVSVDVAEDPARRGTCDAFIAGHRADEARARDDRFGAVRRHAWKYVNQHFAQHRVQLRGDGRRRRLEVNPQHFFGDGERYARAGEFRRVHVAIDPRGGPDARRFTTNGKQPQFATFGRGADGCELADLGIGGRPRAQLRGDGVV